MRGRQRDPWPGRGLHGRRVLPVATGFTFAFPAARAGQHAVTLTATADDGGTSEFSPFLTIGHTARSFSNSGVTPTTNSVTMTTTTSLPPAGDRAATSRSARSKPTAHCILQILCPPITTGSCTGTLVLATTGQSAIAPVRKHFRLAPGQGDTITFTTPANFLSRLRHTHRLAAKAAITAYDAARHRDHKTTVTKPTLRLADKRSLRCARPVRALYLLEGVIGAVRVEGEPRGPTALMVQSRRGARSRLDRQLSLAGQAAASHLGTEALAPASRRPAALQHDHLDGSANFQATRRQRKRTNRL